MHDDADAVLGRAFDLPRRRHVLCRDLLNVLYRYGNLIYPHHLLLRGD